jgi:Holliday junction resolvase
MSSHTHMSEIELYRAGLALVSALFVLQTLRLAFLRRAPARALAKRVSRAIAGERESVSILEAAGFRVEAAQASAVLEYVVDGVVERVDVRADFIVRRGKRRFVAEVKTGAHATLLTNRATRRQLLEYAHAFDAHGVLLVDADARRVQSVQFPTRPVPAEEAESSGFFVWACSLVALGLVALAARLL